MQVCIFFSLFKTLDLRCCASKKGVSPARHSICLRVNVWSCYMLWAPSAVSRASLSRHPRKRRRSKGGFHLSQPQPPFPSTSHSVPISLSLIFITSFFTLTLVQWGWPLLFYANFFLFFFLIFTISLIHLELLNFTTLEKSGGRPALKLLLLLF